MMNKSKKALLKRTHPGVAHPVDLRRCALADYLSGMSRREVALKYCLPDPTILSYWKRKFAPDSFKPAFVMRKPRKSRSLETDNESCMIERIGKLERALALKERELASKEKQLKDTQLSLDMSRMLIDMAEQEYKIAIRKNSGTK